MDGRKERMVQARLSAEQRAAIDAMIENGSVLDVSSAVRSLIPRQPWPAVIDEFARQVGLPADVPFRLVDLLCEIAALGLRVVLCETQPALDPSDLKDLSPRDMAATYLRWRRATEWALACAAAAARGKAAPTGPPFQLFAKGGDSGHWELRRTDATDQEFESWVRASHFDPAKLTPVQLAGLRSAFERSRDADEARSAIGDEA